MPRAKRSTSRPKRKRGSPTVLTALADTVFELGKRDDRDADISNGLRGEALDDGGRMFFDQVDADVRVQHQVIKTRGLEAASAVDGARPP
jgi:hypothetical protein